MAGWHDLQTQQRMSKQRQSPSPITVFFPPMVSFLLALVVLFTFARWQEQPLSIVSEETIELLEDALTPADEEELASLPDAPPQTPESKEEEDKDNWLEYRIRRGDTMENILNATHADNDMRRALLNASLKTHRRMRLKDTVYFKLDDNGTLAELLYKTSPKYYLTAGRDAAGLPWAKEDPPVLEKTRFAYANRIESSLFKAAEESGMTDSAINNLIEVLETQIDFYRDVRKGDEFRVIYDEWGDPYGEWIKTDDVLAFEYTSTKSSRPRVIRGVLNPADGNYYTPDGNSLSRAFLPAPLKFRRISSTFSLRRFHPILKKWRAHRGIDYAASTGTPVRTTADGVVVKARKERGYGNVVVIKHFNIYKTVYAHLQRFASTIKRGKKVKQGDVIGYVGQSGLATGPHLHYEFRINDKHKDPLSVKIQRQLPPLKGEALSEFKRATAPFLAELNALS